MISKHNRGHECADHRAAKLLWRSMLLTAHFDIVMCEYHNADVIAMQRLPDRMFVMAIEGERTARNVVRNIRRNLANKVDVVLEICMPPLSPPSVARLINRSLTEEERAKVLVMRMQEVTVELLQAIGRKAGVDSGLFSLTGDVMSERDAVSSAITAVQSQQRAAVSAQRRQNGTRT